MVAGLSWGCCSRFRRHRSIDAREQWWLFLQGRRAATALGDAAFSADDACGRGKGKPHGLGQHRLRHNGQTGICQQLHPGWLSALRAEDAMGLGAHPLLEKAHPLSRFTSQGACLQQPRDAGEMPRRLHAHGHVQGLAARALPGHFCVLKRCRRGTCEVGGAGL